MTGSFTKSKNFKYHKIQELNITRTGTEYISIGWAAYLRKIKKICIKNTKILRSTIYHPSLRRRHTAATVQRSQAVLHSPASGSHQQLGRLVEASYFSSSTADTCTVDDMRGRNWRKNDSSHGFNSPSTSAMIVCESSYWYCSPEQGQGEQTANLVGNCEM